MKKLIVTLSISLFILPILVGAHSGGGDMMADFSDIDIDTEMIQFIEDKALGEELHEEMEGLMVRMMSGNLTEVEAERTIELMEEYPAPHSMMMNRLTGMNFSQSGGIMPWTGMMGGGFWFWILWLTSIVWLVVGILVIVWLWKKITKK